MAERKRILADEIPVLSVKRHYEVLPLSFDILLGRNPKEKKEILIQQTIKIDTVRRKGQIVEEKYEIKTDLGIFSLTHTLSNNSWHIDRLELLEE